MKRSIRLRHSFSTRRFDVRAWAIDLPIAASDVVPLVCEIAMLLYGRSDQLSLLFDRGRKLVVSIGESAVIGSNDSVSSVSLARNEVEFILGFLLTWYRDGVAEANHIDVELVGSQSAGRDCTLVITAEESQPPLSGDEAGRILREME